MSFQYNWKINEANFGPPISTESPGGSHIAFEIILKKGKKLIALRRPKGVPEHELPEKSKNHPEGLLYFCHNLIRHGESIEDCIKRIVNDQSGVGIKNFEAFYIDSSIQEKDGQWAFVPHFFVEVDDIPETNNLVTEVIVFDNKHIPENFAWWDKNGIRWLFKNI